jgi:predicted  nucleic acid-binding Zn-ribbon protein
MNVELPNTCKLCGKNFRDENNLKRHQMRKNPCVIQLIPQDVVNNPNRCIHCNKVFSKKANLVRHTNNCKMKNGGIAAIPDPNIRLAEQVRILAEELEKEKEGQRQKDEEQRQKDEEQRQKDEKIAAEVAEIHAMMKELLLRPAPPANGAAGNVTNNIGTQNNIIINNYNTPNMDHLLEFDSLYNTLGKYDIDLPIKMILNAFFDPSHPENAAIHLIDKDIKHVLAKVNDQWNTFRIDKITEELREMGYKYAAEAIRIHCNPEFPDRCEYIKSKMGIIEKIKHQKISPKSREYELGMIEEKIFSEYDASSQHPAVIADREKKKKAITAAKKGEI